MRGLAVIVVLSVATLSSSSRVSKQELLVSDLPDCPPEDPTLPPAYFPNPDDNTTFYVCSWGTPILQKCPAGLIWNTQLNTCDRGESIVSPVTPGDQTTSTTSVPATNPNECPLGIDPIEILLPNPEDCSTYYKCKNGMPVLQYCPSDLEWNDEEKQCDYPETARCTTSGGSTSNPEPTSNPGTNPTGCPPVNGPKDVLLPNPQNCGTFFKCDNGVPILLNCPEGLEWNDEKKQCDYPETAHCTVTGGSTSYPEPTTISMSTSNPGTNPSGCPAVNGPKDVLLPNPENCGTFFKCDNGVPILLYCPEDLEWNDEKKYCDYPENAHCTVTTYVIE